MNRVEFTDTEIRIHDDFGNEIVMWTEQEWIDEPQVVFAIANAILVVSTKGPSTLKQMLASGNKRGV